MTEGGGAHLWPNHRLQELSSRGLSLSLPPGHQVPSREQAILGPMDHAGLSASYPN
jgi:hypothetical protein